MTRAVPKKHIINFLPKFVYVSIDTRMGTQSFQFNSGYYHATCRLKIL